MPAVPQVRSSAYLPFVEFLERAGQSVGIGLEGQLIPAIAHRDAEALVPIHLAHSYLEHGARKLGRKDFGILVGDHMRVADLGAFGRSLCRSLTLHDALCKFYASYSLYSSAERIWWTVNGKDGHFLHTYLFDAEAGSRYARHCAMLLMRDLIRMAAGSEWQPILVLTTDVYDTALLRDAFQGAEVRVSNASGLAFPAELLSRPLNHRVQTNQLDRDLHAFNASTPSDDFVGSLKQVIATLVSEGQCRLEHAAGALAIHPRTLQRQLAACEQDYSELLAQVRFEKALRMLDDVTLRVFDIALDLGFEDPSNFSRAFRRWTGVTPSEFRANMRNR